MRTWKQLICGLLGTTLCAGLLGAVPAAAAMTTESATEDDSGISVDTSGDAAYDVFTYRENDTGVTITSCDTSATPLSFVYPVASVPNNSPSIVLRFCNCFPSISAPSVCGVAE